MTSPPNTGPIHETACRFRKAVSGWVLAGAWAIGLPAVLLAQVQVFPLTVVAGLRLHNVAAEPATLDGKAGIEVTMAEAARKQFAETGEPPEQLVVIEGLEFGDGTITAEIAGSVQPGVFEAARGFVGVAFRLQPDMRTYDAIYLRPTNGRAEDQERRNHAVQYISHPEWTWFRLRSDAPSRYESYVDLVPDTWTSVKIEVRGTQARLYVHGTAQPTLIVNDLKTGEQGRGAVALWLDVGTVAHFRNLTVTR